MKLTITLFFGLLLIQVVLVTEKYTGIADGAFQITLTKPSLHFNKDSLKEACLGKSLWAVSSKIMYLLRGLGFTR